MPEDILDDFKDKKSSVRPLPVWIIILLVLFPCVLFISNAISFREIDSILLSGPLLGVISLFLIIAGLVKRRLFPTIIGGLGLLAILFVFLVINIFELSPSEAEKPIPLMICFFSGGTVVLYLLFMLGKVGKPKIYD